MITLAVDDWLLDRLLTLEGAEDLEDSGGAEPDHEAEMDGVAC